MRSSPLQPQAIALLQQGGEKAATAIADLQAGAATEALRAKAAEGAIDEKVSQ